MESNEHMNWGPGLGRQSHTGSSPFPAELETSLNTQAMCPEADKVQYSIVCDDCGHHFWSRSKAESHAALTAHVLHEEHASPSSPVTIPESPIAISVSFPEPESLSPPATEAKASPRTCRFGYEHGEDSRHEHCGMCYDCDRHFWSHKAAINHARIGHRRDIELLPPSVPDESPTTGYTGPAVNPTYPAGNSGIYPNDVYWNTWPSYDCPAANGSTNPRSPCWTNKQPSPSAVSSAASVHAGGVDTSSSFGNINPTSGRTMDLFYKKIARREVPNPEAFYSKNDDFCRRPSRVSPSRSTSDLPSTQDLPLSMNSGTQKILTPITIDSPSPNLSSATLERPLVDFPRELYDRIFFIVTPSGNRNGPGFIMGLAEAQNAVMFRNGVHGRLGSHGEQVGLREIVAHIPWLSVPVYAESDEDHYHLLIMIKSWPEWQKTNWNASCHISITLEDEREEKGDDGLQQEMQGKPED